jgi:pimeloyl-ACP methyl ester carboxylesterase
MARDTDVRPQDPHVIATTCGDVAVRRWGSGAPVVLLHSNGHSFREFVDVIPVLAPYVELHAWDMPGHGDSESAEPPASVAGFADVLDEVLSELELTSPVLVGCSIGAFIAAELLARGRRRLSGAVLVEFAYRDSAWWETNWELVCDFFRTPVQSTAEIQGRLVVEASPQLVLEWNEDRVRAGASRMIDVMWAIRLYDMRSTLASLDRNVAVVYGREGPTISTRADVERDLSAADASFEIIDGAGHFVTIDAPQGFASAVLRFLRARHPDATDS